MSSAWAPAGGGAAAGEPGERRCGNVRASMATNVLIVKTETGRVKKTTFVNAPPGHAFGASTGVGDAEGAREGGWTSSVHAPQPILYKKCH
jgi:Domain of unknown function (DUF4483)